MALLDTGVVEVEGLRAGNVVYGPDLSYEADDPALRNMDTYRHGTHMAGVIAGRDSGSYEVDKGDEDHFLGMPPRPGWSASSWPTPAGPPTSPR